MAKKTIREFVINLCADYCRHKKIPELMITKAMIELKRGINKRAVNSEAIKVTLEMSFDTPGEDEFVEVTTPILMEAFNGVSTRVKTTYHEAERFCREYYRKEQGKA